MENNYNDIENMLNSQFQKDIVDTNKVPILRGCSNQQCFCTGKCKEIIGFRDRLPGELFYRKLSDL